MLYFGARGYVPLRSAQRYTFAKITPYTQDLVSEKADAKEEIDGDTVMEDIEFPRREIKTNGTPMF